MKEEGVLENGGVGQEEANEKRQWHCWSVGKEAGGSPPSPGKTDTPRIPRLSIILSLHSELYTLLLQSTVFNPLKKDEAIYNENKSLPWCQNLKCSHIKSLVRL